MKKTVLMTLVCAFLSVSVPAAAEEDSKGYCTRVSEVAQVAMKGRQKGMAMSEMMKYAEGSKTFEYMVMAAYDKPRYSTASAQQRTIEEFRDDAYVQCFKAVRR